MTYDVIVVGGGIAGLSSALILGRARRKVLVLDAGAPRNQPASHAHGFVTRDGTPPLELLRIAREELAPYPGVEVMRGKAVDASATETGFRVALEDGTTVEARKLVLATGVSDLLPDIPGVKELWGNGVYHCPYCHGWEVRDRPWALLGAPHLAYERAALFRGWTPDLTLLTEGAALDPEARSRLDTLGVTIDDRAVRAVEPDGDGVRVQFTEGRPITVGGIFAVPPQVQRSPLPERLGCDIEHFEPLDADHVKADAVTGETTIPGVYAAGDMTGPAQSVVLAAASGARAAYALNRAIALEDALDLTPA